MGAVTVDTGGGVERTGLDLVLGLLRHAAVVQRPGAAPDPRVARPHGNHTEGSPVSHSVGFALAPGRTISGSVELLRPKTARAACVVSTRVDVARKQDKTGDACGGAGAAVAVAQGLSSCCQLFFPCALASYIRVSASWSMPSTSLGTEVKVTAPMLNVRGIASPLA